MIENEWNRHISDSGANKGHSACTPEDYILEAKWLLADYLDMLPNQLYVVWFAKVLQNYKVLMSGISANGEELPGYYEITFSGDKQEWYIDTYTKAENKVIKKGR